MKLIRLKPLTPYFFGYRNTFSKRGENYFVKSALYPQQTTILGMLRKEILLQAGLLKRYLKDEWVEEKDREKAIELVGSGKFYFFEKEIENRERARKEIKLSPTINLGKIKKIYPVTLYDSKNKEFLFEAPEIESIEDNFFIKFDYKKGVWNRVFGKNNSLKKDDIFISYEIVGNKKRDEKEAYFKKIAYKLKGLEFAFFVDMDFELKNSVVKLGADNSLFEMKVEESDISLDDIEITLPIKTNHKLTLLIGDSYINNLECDFAITDESEFKTIKQKRNFYKTKPLFLYKKGSLIVNNKTKIENASYTKIGFNYVKEAK